MANLGKIVYLSEAQKDELFENGSVTSNGTTITYNENDIYVTPSSDIIDIRVNGTSIVSSGVANVPIAGTSALGVVKPAGMGVHVNSSNGEIYVTKASEAQIKAGVANYAPIVPSNQHDATFYGLAKAAGDSTQAASSNAVGVYTNNAKVSIGNMLGYDARQWELIREDTFTNATEADHEITVDSNNQAFSLTDIVFQFETPKQNTASAKGNYGYIGFYYGTGSSSYYAVEPGAWTQEANTSAHGCTTIIEQQRPLLFVGCTSNTTSTNSGSMRYRYYEGFSDYPSSGIFETSTQRAFNKIVIKAVTGTGHYKLYGKRAIT